LIKLFISDDHAIVREGLKQIVSDTPDITVAGEATNGLDALKQLHNNDYDAVLLDIAMPGMSGMDVLKQLRMQHPNLPVLILSMYPEEQYAIRALKAGANGYLTKDSAPEELVNAIGKITSGGYYVSPSLAEKMASELRTDTYGELHQALSDREYQILCMIAAGKKVADIADELKLSVKTVSTYRSRILAKMHMNSNVELTRYAIEKNFIT